MAGRIIFFGVIGLAAIAVIVVGFYRVVLRRMEYDHEASQSKAEREYDEFIAAVEDDYGGPIDDQLAEEMQRDRNGRDRSDEPPRRARTYHYEHEDDDNQYDRW